LAVLLGGLLLFRLGDDLPLRSHEALVAETARNMVLNRPARLADGSRPSPYLVPNFNDIPRLRKWPLVYWMVAGIAQVTGGVDAWSARLPSALAALGTALVVAALARRYDRLTALVGAAVLATSAGFLVVARSGVSDMPMTLFCTASLASLWMAVEARGRRRLGWFVLAGAAAGLAMIAKSPAPPLLVLPLPCLVAIWVIVARLVRTSAEGKSPAATAGGRGPSADRDAESGNAGRGRPAAPGTDQAGRRAAGGEWLWTLAGGAAALVILLAIVLPWPAYVCLRVPEALAVWKAEAVDRSLGEYGHQEPFWFYLVRLPVLAAPWTVFFLYGMVVGVQRLRRVPAERAFLAYVGAWLVGPLMGFSAAAGKQDHYILPLFPVVAILAALAVRHLVTPEAPRQGERADGDLRPAPPGPMPHAEGSACQKAAAPPSRTVGRRLLVVHGAVFLLAGVASLVPCVGRAVDPDFLGGIGEFEQLARHGLLGAVAAAGWLAVVGGAASIILAMRLRLGGSMAVLVATVAAVFLWTWPTLIGPLDRSRRAVDFARHVRQIVPDNVPLFAYRGTSNSVIFYVGRPMPPLADPAGVQRQMVAGQAFYVVTDDRYLPQLESTVGVARVHYEPDPYRPTEGLWLLKASGNPCRRPRDGLRQGRTPGTL
jgi:4-amino-4-deoxy-L-arabinose transferase-like glycosyltransferase